MASRPHALVGARGRARGARQHCSADGPIRRCVEGWTSGRAAPKRVQAKTCPKWQAHWLPAAPRQLIDPFASRGEAWPPVEAPIPAKLTRSSQTQSARHGRREQQHTAYLCAQRAAHRRLRPHWRHSAAAGGERQASDPCSSEAGKRVRDKDGHAHLGAALRLWSPPGLRPHRLQPRAKRSSSSGPSHLRLPAASIERHARAAPRAAERHSRPDHGASSASRLLARRRARHHEPRQQPPWQRRLHRRSCSRGSAEAESECRARDASDAPIARLSRAALGGGAWRCACRVGRSLYRVHPQRRLHGRRHLR